MHDGMNSQEFARRFLSGKIDLDPAVPEVTSSDIQGLVIKSLPIYQGAAKRLKTVVRRYRGDVPIYLQIEDEQPIHVGNFNVTYDSYKALDRVIKMYQPTYYIVNGEEQHELKETDLYDTIALPTMSERDEYL